MKNFIASLGAAATAALLASQATTASPILVASGAGPGLNAGGEHAKMMEKRCDPWEVYPTYLANDTQDIHYSSGWTILTHQGSFDKGGVEAYNHDACASYSIKIPTFGYLSIYAGKKHDRGYFDVYIGDTWVGTGDAYDGDCQSQCQSVSVFDYDLSESDYGQTLTVRNRQSDSRLGGKTPYLDLNEIGIVPANC